MAKDKEEVKKEEPDYKALYEQSQKVISDMTKLIPRTASEEAQFQRKVSDGEKIVSVSESNELQSQGKAVIVSMFDVPNEKGKLVRMHKIRFVEEK